MSEIQKDNSHKIKKVAALGEPGRAGEGRCNVKLVETVLFPNYSKVKVFKTVFFFYDFEFNMPTSAIFFLMQGGRLGTAGEGVGETGGDQISLKSEVFEW